MTRRDPTKFGRNGDIDLKEIAAHDYPPTTHVNIRPYYAHQARGLALPYQPVVRRPDAFWETAKVVCENEHFRLVEPEPRGQRLKEA